MCYGDFYVDSYIDSCYNSTMWLLQFNHVAVLIQPYTLACYDRIRRPHLVPGEALAEVNLACDGDSSGRVNVTALRRIDALITVEGVSLQRRKGYSEKTT